MITRNVTAQIFDNATPVVGARVTALLTGVDIDGAYIVPSSVEGITDSTGTAVLALWPNARGVRETRYRFRCYLPTTDDLLFDVYGTLPDADSLLVNIADIPPFPGKNEITQANDQAQASAAAASISETNAATSETNAAASVVSTNADALSAGNASTAAGNSETAAGISATNAAASEGNVNTGVAKALQWAEEVEDTEVETGKYSSLHWAAKAQGFVPGGYAANRVLVSDSGGNIVAHPSVGSGIYVKNYDISSLDYTGVSYTSPVGIIRILCAIYNTAGTACYILDGTPGTKTIFKVNTALTGDISSAQYPGGAAYNNGVDSSVLAIAMVWPEHYIYTLRNDRIDQLRLTSGGDLTSLTTFDSVTHGAEVTGTVLDMVLSNSDMSLYILDSNSRIYEYQFGTWNDFTTLSYSGRLIDLSAIDANIASFDLSQSGDELFFFGSTSLVMRKMIVTTPWDISTAVDLGFSFPINAFIDQPASLNFNHDGGKCLIGRFTGAAFQYNTNAVKVG